MLITDAYGDMKIKLVKIFPFTTGAKNMSRNIEKILLHWSGWYAGNPYAGCHYR